MVKLTTAFSPAWFRRIRMVEWRVNKTAHYTFVFITSWDRLKPNQPVSIPYCKTVYLGNVVNRLIDEHSKQCQAKVVVTRELGNKHQLLQRIASITFFHEFIIMIIQKLYLLIVAIIFCNPVFKRLIISYPKRKKQHFNDNLNCYKHSHKVEIKQYFIELAQTHVLEWYNYTLNIVIKK